MYDALLLAAARLVPWQGMWSYIIIQDLASAILHAAAADTAVTGHEVRSLGGCMGQGLNAMRFGACVCHSVYEQPCPPRPCDQVVYIAAADNAGSRDLKAAVERAYGGAVSVRPLPRPDASGIDCSKVRGRARGMPPLAPCSCLSSLPPSLCLLFIRMYFTPALC